MTTLGICFAVGMFASIIVAASAVAFAASLVVGGMRVIEQRDNLVVALEDNFRQSNPGEEMPDWLVVTQSMADYRAGKWRTADEVLEELSEDGMTTCLDR